MFIPTKRKLVGIYVDPEDWSALKQIAREDNRSAAGLIRNWMREAVREQCQADKSAA